MPDLITVKNLVAERGAFRLQIPDWTVQPGAVVGVVGPNGAGKTTLLRILAGLDAANEGQVSVLGNDPIADPTRVRQDLGFMSDDMPLFRQKVGRLFWTLSGYWPRWNAALVDELVKRFDLDLSRGVWELSKGQGTRVRLICALAFEPKVVVLDEPATGLDVAGRRALLETVLDVVSEPNRSVIVSSHQLADLQRIADELLVLSDGQVVQRGPTDQLVGDDRTLEEALVQWGAA
ncbi:MAG: ABC transporter ATP-binding protein [Proteobacteria bacterium]|nr:ABC transporter ATP-binding protein [Pseudomonadota bacterium]MCP4917174.1 ABC transporter ATP-binding protein [Pseudomonadota bacterium]